MPQEQTESSNFLQKAAEIARKPQYAIPTLLIVGGIAYGVGQSFQREQNLETVSQVFKESDDYYTLIEKISEQPAILSTADVVFEVKGVNLYDQALDQLETVPEFSTDYAEHKDLIDSTLLESTKSLGIYHEGDDIALTRLLLDDAQTPAYVAQFVTDESSTLSVEDWIPLLSGKEGVSTPEATVPPAATELPTPDTH